MKKWQKFLIWLLWAIAFIVACELTDYWLGHNFTSFLYINTIEIMFFVLGFVTAYLPIKSSKLKKRKQK